MLRQARIAVREDSDRAGACVRLPAAFPLSQSTAWSHFPFGRTLSIAPHRLVDLASPSIDAAVEVDCVVKAGGSKKVDDHLTASAMMANDHQQLIRRKVVGRAGISAIGTCRAPSSLQISSSLASRTSRTVCSFPALRMSASSRTEIASDPRRCSVDISRLSPDLHYSFTYVGLETGQETSPRREVTSESLHCASAAPSLASRRAN